MIIRHKVTGQEIEGDFRQSMGWWQQERPMVSYPMSEWEEVVSDEVRNEPSAIPSWVPVPASSYINRLTAGMQAKKYKGGQAARIKAQTSRLFESYFKPLPQ
jgi:hypothetical protein